MKIKFTERLICAVCAAAVLFSSVNSISLPLRAAAEAAADSSAAAEPAEPETPEAAVPLCQQSIELYPNGEEAEQVITLDGLMPEGATAEAVDVSEEHNGIAAYDITITNGETEYQPGWENPILVEITNPAIPPDGLLELWHIRDDGERERIYQFTAEEGKISFYAEAFSVYEIVRNDIISYLAEHGEDGDGIHVSYVASKLANANTNNPSRGGPYYIYNEIIDVNNDSGTHSETRTGIKSTVKGVSTNSANLFFEHAGVGNQFYVYFKNADGTRNYIEMYTGDFGSPARTGLRFAAKEANRTVFTLEKHPSSNQFRLYAAINGDKYYWNRKTTNNSGNPTSEQPIAGFKANDDDGQVWFSLTENIAVNIFLNNCTYGLMNYTGGTHGYALMAEGENGEDGGVHSLVEIVTRQHSETEEGTMLFVDEGSEITRWTFHGTGTDQTYTLSAETGSGTRYLAVDGSSLILTDSEAAATPFTVNPDSNGAIQLSYNGSYLTFHMEDDGENAVTYFNLSSDNNANTWLNLLNFADLSDDDLLTFSADRVSVSDIRNGQSVIMYTRIWNESTLQYDIYALDFNGQLYPCYTSGGKILWLGDGTSSLEWTFTEYYDEVTKEPNYYYELYNPYSEKYLAPQLNGNQLLSEDPIGVNMPGRRNGEFYSPIIAWDNKYYSYVGLKPSADKKRLVPCTESAAFPIYFATREPLNLNDRLYSVPTVDNNLYGIKMKMVNWDNVPNSTYGDSSSSEITMPYFGGSQSIDKLVHGLVSNSLNEYGYPKTITGANLQTAYANAIPVNHLFLEREYDASGYFEFDSCQNFATLKKTNPDGTTSFNTNAATGETDFIVYRELGTHEQRIATTRKHGQFFPYDTIAPDIYSSQLPLNLYDALERPLSEDDPRKYERLHLIQTDEEKFADFYFGMEMEADFVQTPSGLDSWGHDIIFEFTGDDDFWLYVDGQLVLDLGGTHKAMEGKINFRTGDVYFDKNKATSHGTLEHSTLLEIFTENYKEEHTNWTQDALDKYLSDYFDKDGSGNFEPMFKDYSQHTMKVFYMERGAGASNLHMRFNITAVTPGQVVVSKSVSGSGADLLDLDFLEYPFQIYYTLPDGENGEEGEWRLLENSNQLIRVQYQNSNQSPTFVRRYRPPGFTEDEAYQNIYFINPTRNAVILFPESTIRYKIVECAVDSSVYDSVTINGEPVPDEDGRIKVIGDLTSYASEEQSAEIMPTISFDNHVNDDVIKDLFITKKLLDEKNREIKNDPATFDFRLYLSSVSISADKMEPANMHQYHVLSPNKQLCRFDPDSESFQETGLTYSRALMNSLKEAPINGITAENVTFSTSGFGAISAIPSGYTIVVPGLPVNSVFRVTESAKPGYGLAGYERVMGEKVMEDYSVQMIPSYYEYDGNELNVGRVRADVNPQLEIHNKKGYSLSVKKQWSDLSLTTSHAPIYTAVYADGELLPDSVRQIKAPATTAHYFWTALKPNADGSKRTGFEGYTVREVKISEPSPTVSADGIVTNYGTVTPLDNGDSFWLTATRTNEATPPGEPNDHDFEYVASYDSQTLSSTAREDTISNTRIGGVVLRLFKWDSEQPLAGGVFTLKDSSGNTVGTYSSNTEGLITMMYSFERGQPYTLTQTLAPRGYVGLQKTVKFVINEDDTISLLYENGNAWGTADINDSHWANSKPGADGVIGFIDVYNKPFTFRIAKLDADDPDEQLSGAHFALYKQEMTSIMGYVKCKAPMTGFEDMVTKNGSVDICGGNSGRTIKLADTDSVFFLTEKQAPFNYTPLKDDIIFSISPLGVPRLISDSYNGTLEQTEDAYVYTLSVPNTKIDPSLKYLTVEKTVEGALGNRAEDFTFTISFPNAGTGSGFDWAKNGDKQTPIPRSGGTFTLKHDDRAEIVLPENIQVRISEAHGQYETVFQLGENDPRQHTDTPFAFTFTGPVTLHVTNTLNGEVATGISSTVKQAFVCITIPLAAVGTVCYRKRKRKNAA
ncbi:MAG: hypothetical protein IKQ39_05190 [Oscillospiraceae bacterium]|nr:hypothetical protein [Oscillospiraceae bacterium]